MAELDDKLLKNLDATLQNMNTHLQNLESTLRGVKGGIDATFNPAIIKSFSDEIRGLKAARIIDADKSVAEVNKVYSAIQELSYMVKTGMKLEPVSLEQLDQYKKRLEEIDKLLEPLAGKRGLKTDEYLQRSSLYRERDKLRAILDSENPVVPVPLKKEEIAAAVEMLKRYEEVYKNIRKGDQQRAVEIANIAAKERSADMRTAEAAVSQREQAERRKAEIARAWAEQEAREKAQREKMKTASEKAAADERTAIAEAEAKKKSEIAKAWAEQDRRRYEKDGDPLGEIAARKGLTGTLAALEDQTAVNEWRKQTAEEQKRIAKEEAEVEKQIKKEIAEEEKKLAAEEKQRYQDAVAANKAMTKAEDDLAEAKRKARTAESKAAYTEDTKQRIEEERKAARERAQQAKEAAAIQKKADAESMANQRRQIQIKSQLAAIDKNRISITKQSSDREKALAAQQQADYRSLQSELSKLIARQKELNAVSQGSGRGAKDRLSTYTISESEKAMRRYADAVRNAHREQKKLGDETNKMLPTLQRLASAFGVAFSVRGLAQFGKKLIETRGEFERQQVALRSILQNKQLADEIWDKTMQAALQSPFTAMQLTTYTKQLAAYRIETDKLFETTKRLADVSAGLGVDMNRLILAYGQVKAANYLRASEIRQFTEAGVNVLGELMDYFNDVKGMSVDTAKVMKMVTKRLVTFEDVEAIFKRMTDAGGIFYEMQYVQSQTVRGQIAKLHDAYDQMLNSIGQANEGVLKKFVSLLNNIIKNWREWKTVIDLIAWPLIISALYKFALGLVATATSMNRMTVAGAKLQVVLKKLWVTVMSNPWLALATAILAAGVAARNHAKNVEAINKKYEELMLRVYETQKNLDGLSETIKNNLDTMKKSTKGSEEYNEANRQNENIVKKLKEQYPDLLKDIDLQKDGYEKLIERIKEYNEELEYQIKLEYAARASFWQDDLTTNIAELQEFQNKREMQFLKNRELAEQRYLALKAQGKEAEEDIWNKRMRLAKDWQEQTEIINEQNEQIYKEQERARSSANEGIVFTGNWSLQSQGFVIPNAGNFWGANVEKQKQNLKKNIQDEALVFNEIIREQLRNINEDLGEDIEQFIADNKTQVEELFKDKEGEGWKILNKQITRFFTAKGATDKETRKVIQDYLNQFLHIPIQLDWSNTGGSSNTPTPETSGNKTRKNASKLISLIKEMRGEYDKLSKSAYGYAKSEEKVRESYKDSVKEILGKAGITDYDFTTNEGMIKALEKVKSYATKLGADAAAEVQKYIDQLETEIEINAQVKIREDFVKEIEKSFNDYELTLELDKLNISPEAAKNLFPEFDSQTLGELQDVMQEFYEKQGTSFDEEDLKAYKQWSDKIDAEILKSRKEKAKEYSKYLEKEYSERAKVEMQYAKDVAFVTANFNGEQQKNILKGIEDKYQKDINELTWKSFKESAFYVEMMDDLSSVPADYMKIMLDKIEELLAHPETLSPRALKEAINARQKIIEAQMDFDQIAVMKGSVSEIRAAANDVGGKTWAQTKKRLDEEQKAQADKLKGLEEEIRCYEEIQGQLKGLEQHDEAVATANRALPEDVISMLENTDIDTLIKQYSDELDSISVSEEATTSAEKDANAQIQARIEYLQRIIPLLVDYRTALDERSAYQATDAGQNALFSRGGGETSSSVGQTINEYKKEAEQVSNRLSTLKKWQKAFTNFNNSFSKFNKNAADMVGRLGALSTAAFDLYDALGGETDAMTDAWKDFGGTIVNTITQALEMIPALVAGFVTAGTTINAAMGIIGLIAEAIQLVLVLITGLSKLHDAGYEKEIENQQKIIDNLQRAYNRLEKEIEKTWDTASYIRTYNEETQNLYEQIEALNKQIAAEEAKKNTDKDKIQGYKDSIQDAEDELDELKQKQIEVFGGIGEEGYRDAAQGFVDAWKSAFLETGDGLQGLQDHFDEFLQDWFAKQITMKYAAAALQPMFDMIDAAVDKYGPGGVEVIPQELESINKWAEIYFPQISEELEKNARLWGLEGEGSLSGLAAGIQGMTEEQANILESYWNSVRGYTANIDMNVATIVGLLSGGTNGGGGGSKGNIFGDPNVETNPMLKQLDLIAVNTAATHRILESVTKSGHSQGGYGIKVFAD